MPEYHFTGAYPRVLTGLSQGVNASLTGSVAPHGSTIEALPGCGQIVTDEPYAHPELAEVEASVPFALVAADSTPEQLAAGLQAVQDATAQGAAGLDVLNTAAHESMTAEGAPAPAEPTL